MRLRHKISALVLTCLFLLPLGLSFKAQAADLTADAAGSARWLREACPSPNVGDEMVMLALLRGSFVTNLDAYTQEYLQRLSAHVESGAAAAQPPADSARQGMVLAAAGINIPEALPALLQTLASAEAIAAGGLDAQSHALLLFGVCGVQPPAGLDVATLAQNLAAGHNEDGGFGAGGVSDGLATAQALQALAGHAATDGVEEAMLNARFWLQLNSNYLGGYDLNDAPSPEATAAAMLAAACDGQDPDYIGMESAPMSDALLVFFNRDEGSFLQNPDSTPDVRENAVCLLGLVAKQRHERSKTAVFDFSDAAAGVINPTGKEPGQPDTSSSTMPASGGDGATSSAGLSTLFGLSTLLGIGTPMLLALAGGIIVIVLLLAILLSGRRLRKTRNRRKPRHPKKRAPAASTIAPKSSSVSGLASKSSSASGQLTYKASAGTKSRTAKAKTAKKDKNKKNGKYTHRM